MCNFVRLKTTYLTLSGKAYDLAILPPCYIPNRNVCTYEMKDRIMFIAELFVLDQKLEKCKFPSLVG